MCWTPVLCECVFVCLFLCMQSQGARGDQGMKGEKGHKGEAGLPGRPGIPGRPGLVVSIDGYTTCDLCDKKAIINLFLTRFRDPKESQWLVHKATLGCQVLRASQAMADQDRSALLDHRGLQDPLRHTQDMAQVQFIILLFHAITAKGKFTHCSCS